MDKRVRDHTGTTKAEDRSLLWAMVEATTMHIREVEATAPNHINLF
jgi:hypothetical protein